MRVSGFWSFAGALVMGYIALDFLSHPSGTKQVFQGTTGLVSTTGKSLSGA